MTQNVDDGTNQTAHVFHHRFEDPENPGEHHPVGVDLGMGYDFAVDHGSDPAGNFDPETFVYAGSVDDVETAGEAYEAWEHGAGHDPTKTRSMAVGDLIVMDGDAYFVDSFGFEQIEIETGAVPIEQGAA